MEQIGISIKGSGVQMFDKSKITNLRIKAGCGCVLFTYNGKDYKPTLPINKMREILK